MHYPDAKVLIFTKTPITGQVKTRLIPALGSSGAKELHCRMVEHTLATFSDNKRVNIELHCSPDIEHEYIISLSSRYHLTLKKQHGTDLGERMSNALDQALTENRYVILIGTDCPALTLSYIEQAIEILKSGTDIVIGPAEDGGYVLIGVTASHPEIFNPIDWSSHKVMQQTRDAILKQGLSLKELNVLRDIDTPDDLEYLTNTQRYANLFSPQKKMTGDHESRK